MTRSKQRSKARRWLAASSALVLLAMAVMIPAASVRAAALTDPVLVWNANAVSVIGSPTAAPVPDTTPPTLLGLGQGPPIAALHLAMVQGAVYDAVNAIDKGHAPYIPNLPSAPSTASKAAAVAQAAHDVLVGLTPTTLPLVKTRIDDMLTASLALIVDGDNENAGKAIGAAAAAAMLTARIGDGRFGSHTWTDVGPTGPAGKWRLVVPLSNSVFGWFGYVKPLTMASYDQFRTAGPLDMTSAQYTAEFNEVKAKGAQTGSTRTAAETSLAGFVSANPIPYMNKGLRDIAVARGLSTVDQARLFVKTSMASADALIGCFNDKDFWSVWRPQTAIRLAGGDGNPATSPDAGWLSLFASPGYPDHPSGYNCYTAGLWHSARLFFRTDKVTFTLTSPGVVANVAMGNPVGVAGSTRSYHRFTGVIRDTINGRILNGFHFRTPDVQGAWIGKKAAQWLDKHYFAPVR
jgi:hypothetical protein